MKFTGVPKNSSAKMVRPRTSTWGPSIGAPNGHGVFQCIDTTAAYVAKLEKLNKDQNSRIIQLEEELCNLRRAKSESTEKSLADEQHVSSLETKLREDGRQYGAIISNARDNKDTLETACTQLRTHLASLEGQVLAACQRGEVDPTSSWKPTIMEIIHLRQEIEGMAHENARTCKENNTLRAELKSVQSDMLLALDRIHDLVTLNEPHQAFITNMMRERNFWQDLARGATMKLGRAKASEAGTSVGPAIVPEIPKSPKSPNVRAKRGAGFSARPMAATMPHGPFTSALVHPPGP
mmetsp:Transcript_30909/g.51972  ORF Transcript_30909/g.51972 Transcript_30909/m.51972 type:complete len:294 (+) Transcript_30909:92-973(+)|eukprot:CAMPEP_0198205020 /NCGR_PEP_ID=MMETSP1445-20131203/8498_1 /TAXON_ID=36898 /ORGANISM="Pyramimonas sp., Strain CCMP2087" /LENGTH=293 /DNA_ID=CAMNT_0043877155 /DNA_START=249 /DNA_END=1130 /DNA_ORIENTATION=+